MNLKAIVATLEEKCPNLFDQVRADSWLVAAGGSAANHRPATIGIGFIPVEGQSFLVEAGPFAAAGRCGKAGLPGPAQTSRWTGKVARERWWWFGPEPAVYSIRLSMRLVKLFGRNVQSLLD